MAGPFYYFYKYDTRVEALLDPVVAPFLTNLASGMLSLWVYDLRKGGVIAEQGYWFLLIDTNPPSNPALLTIPQFQFMIDVELQGTTGAGVLASNRPLSFLQNVQVVTPYGGFIPKGLNNPNFGILLQSEADDYTGHHAPITLADGFSFIKLAQQP